MIPANAIVLRSVKCSDIHKCIAGYGKATLYGVVDLGRKKFAKVFVMSYMGSRVLQEKLCHLKSTCIQAKQLQYNNDIHYVLMIFIFLHIRRFCISKGGSVPLPSDMRGSTVLYSWPRTQHPSGAYPPPPPPPPPPNQSALLLELVFTQRPSGAQPPTCSEVPASTPCSEVLLEVPLLRSPS